MDSSGEERQSYYVTTPIYYANSKPHIGHAYTSLVADVAARIMRLKAVQVMFSSGTDEHGQKVEAAARAQSQEPQHFVDQVSSRFRELLKSFNISNDVFIRTSEKRHKKAVVHLWNTLLDRGEIYLGHYSGWYASRDEAFYKPQELTEAGLAPTGSPVEWLQEESYFFRLSKWETKLLEFYEKNPCFIQPVSKLSEVVNFVKGGLEDLSISRSSFSWGIKVPNSDKHVIYVWVDALTNYLSAAGYPGSLDKELWRNSVHVMGKDILRFHAVYWPAILMAAGLKPPKQLYVHGWWLSNGKKMSKSLGNVVDPFLLASKVGTDCARYFLLREMTFGNDANITANALTERVNSELADKLGNLVHRTLSIIVSKFEAKIPSLSEEALTEVKQHKLFEEARKVGQQVESSVKSMQFSNALGAIVSLASSTNKYLDETAPWKLLKHSKQDAAKHLYVALEIVRILGILLQPFTPEAAEKLLSNLKVKNRGFDAISSFDCFLEPGNKVMPPEIPFLKLQEIDPLLLE